MSSTASGIWTATLLLLAMWQATAAKNVAATATPQRGNELTLDASPRQYPPSFGMGAGFGGGVSGGGCPLCDSSVYSYCSHKIVHDACCCDFPAQLKPPQCYYYDCAVLYAKSCYEHMLIKNCCCNNPYR